MTREVVGIIADIPHPAMIPKYKNNWNREVIWESSKHAMPNKAPQTVMIKRGLKRSASLPETRAIKPLTTMASENAPEVSPRVQPNSSDKGLKKTPKLEITRPKEIKVKKVPVTTVYFSGLFVFCCLSVFIRS